MEDGAKVIEAADVVDNFAAMNDAVLAHAETLKLKEAIVGRLDNALIRLANWSAAFARASFAESLPSPQHAKLCVRRRTAHLGGERVWNAALRR